MQPQGRDLFLPIRGIPGDVRRPVDAPAGLRGLRSSPPIQVAELSSLDEPAWESFVADQPEATFFHELSWRDAVARTFGHTPHYLAAMRGPAIVGVLPLFEVNSILAGRLLLSMPYATYGGVLSADEDAREPLLRHAKSLTTGLSARCLELRSMQAADPSLPVHATHATFIRALPETVDEIETYLPRKARASARRAAEQNELSVEFGLHAMDEVWRLYARSMRRLGSPNYPLRFFEAIASAAPGRVLVQVVRCKGRPVASLVSFLHRRTVMPYFVGLDERVEIYGLSHYLYRESMRWGVANGFDTFDFGRSRIDNTGPFEFKRLCGFEPRLLSYQRYIPEGGHAPDLSPASSRWALARRLWRKLPIWATGPLGGWLAKSIPG
ncbi:MAG: FemAB family PEP-CTERM system-associated protein [Planctomycetia bacterium]|nr:FemAB family PEP-CTERM system-associated protein [Planctomycetia bacterium]MCC7314198.1 FemAB family PEP-CTERM system-associated protein [Planctomycetota bacterium]